MEKRKSREEKWEEFEQRVKVSLEEARKKALLADSFDEMEEIVDEIGQVIEQDLLGEMAEQREVGGRPNCPACGQPMSRRGGKAAKLKVAKGTSSLSKIGGCAQRMGSRFLKTGAGRLSTHQREVRVKTWPPQLT